MNDKYSSKLSLISYDCLWIIDEKKFSIVSSDDHATFRQYNDYISERWLMSNSHLDNAKLVAADILFTRIQLALPQIYIF